MHVMSDLAQHDDVYRARLDGQCAGASQDHGEAGVPGEVCRGATPLESERNQPKAATGAPPHSVQREITESGADVQHRESHAGGQISAELVEAVTNRETPAKPAIRSRDVVQ
jgi:hypothetical protein